MAVVPIRLIVTNPVNTPGIPSGWFSQDAANVLFDDVWKADVSINSEPGLSPDNVVSQWLWKTACTDSTCNDTVALQPDPIWEQCGIQFRLMEYVACTVQKNAWDNEFTSNSQCSPDVQANSRIMPAINACLAEQQLPGFGGVTVIVVGSLVRSGANCISGDTLGAAKKFGNVFLTSAALTTNFGRYVTAHEFGHVFGLQDLNDVQCSPNDQLMCTAPGSMSNYIAPDSCSAAYQTARFLHDQFWQ